MKLIRFLLLLYFIVIYTLLFYFHFIFQTRKQVMYSLFANIIVLQIDKNLR